MCWLKLRLATGAFIRVFSSVTERISHLPATTMSMRDGNNGAAPKADNRAIPTTPSTIRAPSVNTEPSVGTSLSITDSDVSQSPDQNRLAAAAQKLASQLIFVGGVFLERFCARRAAAAKRDVPRLEAPPVASGACSSASSAQQPRAF